MSECIFSLFRSLFFRVFLLSLWVFFLFASLLAFFVVVVGVFGSCSNSPVSGAQLIALSVCATIYIYLFDCVRNTDGYTYI